MSLLQRPSAVDLLAAVGALADADLHRRAVVFLRVHADARRALADGADDHHVPDGQRRRAVDDPAGQDLRAAHAARVADRARLRVPLDEVQVLDDDLAVARKRLDHAAFLAAVLAAEDVDDVAFANSHLVHQRTSGASETIFMKFFSRSSRATGPKMRVPRGFRCASMIT